MNREDKIVLTVFISIAIGFLVVALFYGCSYRHKPIEYKLNLSDIVETGYGNTLDGDSMYWAIYEEWNNDSRRHFLYMDKETFDSLEVAVTAYNNYPTECHDSINNSHNFVLIKDKEGLHISKIK